MYGSQEQEASVSIGTGHGPVEPDPAEPDPGEPERPGKKWMLAVGGLVGVFVLLGGYALISGAAWRNSGTSAASTTSPAANRATSAAAPATSAAAPAAVPVTPHSSRPSPAGSPAQHALSVTSATAFGPGGTSDGDNPAIASRVISGGTQPWYSSWYATPRFGNLQPGTGLLLDMGKVVKVSSVQVVLGDSLGTAVQVRVGDTAALPDLSAVATATNVGGIVQLPTPTRTSARYILIWFTALPPNGQGKYQVNVYSATVDGTAAT
jgi:hypothetical protein